jgi:DNA topoisomerase-1
MAPRVAAAYKSKKKVKTQDGEDMTVYEYSDAQIASRNKKKKDRITALKSSMEGLRSKVRKDMKAKDPETALTALAVALMDETYERVGNDDSAKDGHFGVTGWKKKHITLGAKSATIKYVGKSGVKHEKKVTDATVLSALRDAYKATDGDNGDLFDHDGGRVTASKVNAYLKEFDITAKDLRGFHANREMQEKLKKLRAAGGKLPSDEKEREKLLKKEFKEALEHTADCVGHEAATLKSQYLMPGLEESFMKDGKITDKLS